MKGGKNAMAKLEMRIRELEMELGSVQSLVRATRPSRGLSAVSRSCNSNKRKIVRIKIAWEIWQTSSSKRSRLTNNKSRNQKKLLPLTWQSTARLNKNLRKLKSAP